MVSLPLADDDTGKLDLVLGQPDSFLDRDGEEVPRDLLRATVLTQRRDGGLYQPMPGDGWTDDTYEAVLTADRVLLPACTKAVTDAIWQRLEPVLTRLQRQDVQSLVVEGDIGHLPAVPSDWRNQTAEADPPIVRRLRIGPPTTEFDVTRQDFSDLEIRGTGLRYFYDTRGGRLITEFLLDDRPQVATLCHVTLINKDGVLSPRIKLWKRDVDLEVFRYPGVSRFCIDRGPPRIHAGMVNLNNGITVDISVPFGGVKQSGYGREPGPEGLDAFFHTRHLRRRRTPARDQRQAGGLRGASRVSRRCR